MTSDTEAFPETLSGWRVFDVGASQHYGNKAPRMVMSVAISVTAEEVVKIDIEPSRSQDLVSVHEGSARLKALPADRFLGQPGRNPGQ